MARERLKAESDERKLSTQVRMNDEKMRAQAETTDRTLRTKAALARDHEKLKASETRRTLAQKTALDVATRPEPTPSKNRRASKN